MMICPENMYLICVFNKSSRECFVHLNVLIFEWHCYPQFYRHVIFSNDEFRDFSNYGLHVIFIGFEGIMELNFL